MELDEKTIKELKDFCDDKISEVENRPNIFPKSLEDQATDVGTLCAYEEIKNIVDKNSNVQILDNIFRDVLVSITPDNPKGSYCDFLRLGARVAYTNIRAELKNVVDNKLKKQ